MWVQNVSFSPNGKTEKRLELIVRFSRINQSCFNHLSFFVLIFFQLSNLYSSPFSSITPQQSSDPTVSNIKLLKLISPMLVKVKVIFSPDALLAHSVLRAVVLPDMATVPQVFDPTLI